LPLTPPVVKYTNKNTLGSKKKGNRRTEKAYKCVMIMQDVPQNQAAFNPDIPALCEKGRKAALEY